MKRDHIYDDYDFGAVATYHEQPPFETQARKWVQATSIIPSMTIAELIVWADKNGIANLETLQITINYKRSK